MIKTVLVPATGGDDDLPVFAAALDVARRFSGHLSFLHVRLDPADVASAVASDGGGAMVSARLIDQLEEEGNQRVAKAKTIVEGFCRKERLGLATSAVEAATGGASWHCETGREADWLAEYGRTADLLVVGRPSDSKGVAPETLEAALIDTGRPLLIPAKGAVTADRVAIAWKSTREAARAVTAAAPFLRAARQVIVLNAAEGDRAEEDSVGRLIATLRRQNVVVESRAVAHGERSVAEALLATASEHGAGLLVMGGYGHSRLREWVFGGVTEHMLRTAALPILMAH